MIVGKQNIISWFESLNVPYWVLFAKGKVESGNQIARSNDTDSATVADSLADLKKILDLQSRGQFTLIAAGKPTVTARGGFREDFEIPSSESYQQSSSQPMIAGYPQSLEELDRMADVRAQRFAKEMKLEMQIERLQEKLEELQKENKELEKEADKGSNRLWDAINGIGVEKIIGLFMPKQLPNVAGIPQTNEVPENDNNYATRLGNVIAIFQANDPDWLDTLEKMAAKIKSDPSVIKMFKKFL